MREELRGLAAELQEMSRRNEALAMEVGQLRERQVGHDAQLAAREVALGAKDETIAANEQVIVSQRAALIAHEQALAADALAIGQLRQQVEAAEAERDRLVAAQAAPAPPHEAGGQEAETHAPDAPGGFLTRVRRFFGGA